MIYEVKKENYLLSEHSSIKYKFRSHHTMSKIQDI